MQNSDNTIGGTAAGAGNVIADNGQAGVAVVDNFNGPTTGVEILSNSIYANQGLGIDLGDDGVTPNHPGGPVYGPNNLQNYPVLTSAVVASGKLTIVGSLNSAADTSYLIQFFANPTADPSGYGQGQVLIGSITVTTDDNGNASFTETFSKVPVGWYISATATDPIGDTSEFAQDVQVTRVHASGSSSSSAVLGVSSVSFAPLASPSAAVETAAATPASPVSDAVLESVARRAGPAPAASPDRDRHRQQTAFVEPVRPVGRVRGPFRRRRDCGPRAWPGRAARRPAGSALAGAAARSPGSRSLPG